MPLKPAYLCILRSRGRRRHGDNLFGHMPGALTTGATAVGDFFFLRLYFRSSGLLQGYHGGIGTRFFEFRHVLRMPDFATPMAMKTVQLAEWDPFPSCPAAITTAMGTFLSDYRERTLLGWRPDSFEELSEEGQYELGAVPGISPMSRLQATTGNFSYTNSGRKTAGMPAATITGLLIYHIDMSENMVTANRLLTG